MMAAVGSNNRRWQHWRQQSANEGGSDVEATQRHPRWRGSVGAEIPVSDSL